MPPFSLLFSPLIAYASADAARCHAITFFRRFLRYLPLLFADYRFSPCHLFSFSYADAGEYIDKMLLSLLLILPGVAAAMPRYAMLPLLMLLTITPPP